MVIIRFCYALMLCFHVLCFVLINILFNILCLDLVIIESEMHTNFTIHSIQNFTMYRVHEHAQTKVNVHQTIMK